VVVVVGGRGEVKNGEVLGGWMKWEVMEVM
jgi:hypothetical protein